MNNNEKYKGIKTTKNRPYNDDYIFYIERSLKLRGFNDKQVSVILGNIIEESGGDPFAKSEHSTYQGLLQWGKDRYRINKNVKDPYEEIDNQLDYLTKSIQSSTDKVSWTHGGEGSGYNKGIHAKNLFFDDSADVDKIHHAFSFGYVRPKGKKHSYNNRLKVVKQVDEIRQNLGIVEDIPLLPKYNEIINKYNDIEIPTMSSFIDNNGNTYKSGGLIKPENRGKFTAKAKKRGMSVQSFARQVLNNKDDYSTATVKQANFARNFGGRKKRDFGGVSNKSYYTDLVKSTNNRDYYQARGVGIKDKYLAQEVELNSEGEALANQYYTNAIGIFSNMQNKINSEILQARGITSEAKYGGLVGTLRMPKKKLYWGGTSNSITDTGSIKWGTEIQPEDISHDQYNADGEGIVGESALSGASTGLGLGATVGAGVSAAAGGAASGTLMGSWAGPIGMGVGALIGSLVGLFSGSRRKKQEEEQRKQLLAQQQEAARQQTLGNMQNKVENDVATIRNQSLGQYSEGTGFYAKFGGLVGRRRLSSGGVVIPNSNNTAVAYGQTHEQMNPITGETGIYYGDSEIEGGGIVRNIAYPGEVIRSTSYGDQVFSDTLKVPGTNKTFADYAKVLTDIKGKKDQEVIDLGDGITLSLNNLDKSKTNKLKTGTAVRNIEKLAYKMNKAKGESEKIDDQINSLFKGQEAYAEILGLRNNGPMLRCGGLVRKKMPYGGITEMASNAYGIYTPTYYINTPSARSLNFSSSASVTPSKIGFSELGLGMNVIGGIAGMIGNALNARSNRKALEFESKLSVPKQSKVEATRYSTDYDINQELQELITQERRASRYITDNTSNVSVARNSISKLAIDSQLAKNRLYAQKKDYQQRRYDLNLAERTNTNNYNNRILYEDALNEYNKTVALNQAASNMRSQSLQGILEGINTIGQAFNNYASGRLYEKTWARGVKNEMRNLAYGGLARRSKRK